MSSFLPVVRPVLYRRLFLLVGIYGRLPVEYLFIHALLMVDHSFFIIIVTTTIILFC